MAYWVERISGGDRSTWVKGRVAGTDLGIPFKLENGVSYGYLFGDSFVNQFPGPGVPGDWRSPVAFRSAQDPKTQTITFDSAYGTPANANGNINAPDIVYNDKKNNDFNAWGQEFTVIPNDATAFATGEQIMSIMSVNRWRNANGSNAVGWTGGWRTNFNSLCISTNGNNFSRPPVDQNFDAIWWNNEQNTDPFQMMSLMDDHGSGWVYAISVRAGRQNTPMMLQRAPWNDMFHKASWQGWNNNGGTWHWGASGECTSLFPEKMMGEPSLRKLPNGTWVMAYLTNVSALNGNIAIVTRKSTNGPTGPWSAEKIQVTHDPNVFNTTGSIQLPNPYGGFIHPLSGTGTNELVMFVSQWNSNNYHVSQVRTTA